jgi:hypothetical protein
MNNYYIAIPKAWNILKTAMVKTYDPKKGPPPKPIHHEPVEIPVINSRDDAGEQGAISQS